jgi:hypothetical protein
VGGSEGVLVCKTKVDRALEANSRGPTAVDVISPVTVGAVTLSPATKKALPERQWIPASEEWPLAIRPLDGGGFELALFLRSLPSLHAAIQAAKGKPHPALTKSIAAAVAASIEP